MDQAKLYSLLAYSTPYAESMPLQEPVGFPTDFVDRAYLASNNFWKDPDVEHFIRSDSAPIPHRENREGYCGDHHLAYWLGGYADYRRTLAVLESHDVKPKRVFEFGASTCRVLRHFACQSGAEVWGCDFKRTSVEWGLRYLPTTWRLFLNNYYPVLPLEDNYFDLVTAYSVFTHIDETETGWLAQLRRVLRPGGIAYLSIHDATTWKAMETDKPHKELRDMVHKLRPDIASSPTLPEGKTVVTWRNDDPYRCNVFHHDNYIKQVWGRFFEIVQILPRQLNLQAIVVCKKI